MAVGHGRCQAHRRRVQPLPQKGEELVNKTLNSLLPLSHQSTTHPNPRLPCRGFTRAPTRGHAFRGSAHAGCPTPSPFKYGASCPPPGQPRLRAGSGRGHPRRHRTLCLKRPSRHPGRLPCQPPQEALPASLSHVPSCRHPPSVALWAPMSPVSLKYPGVESVHSWLTAGLAQFLPRSRHSIKNTT